MPISRHNQVWWLLCTWTGLVAIIGDLEDRAARRAPTVARLCSGIGERWNTHLRRRVAVGEAARYQQRARHAANFRPQARRWQKQRHPLAVAILQAGARGGELNFAAYDASTGKWVWRFLATDTTLVHYRPRFKQHWPNPFLATVKVEPYVLPTLKTMWTGNTDAPLYEATRRVVLERAKGVCERFGRRVKLTVHHIHRVGGSPRDQADNRPEMMQALCSACQAREHRAENIYRAQSRPRTAAGHWVKMRGKPGAG